MVKTNDPLEKFMFNEGENYAHYDVLEKKTGFYLPMLWSILKPYGDILNMGIMKKTPDCLSELILMDSISSITHIELDEKHKVKVSNKEKVIWNNDFLTYLIGSKDRSFDGVVCWHGPEHLSKEDGIRAIKESIRVANRWVVVSCPWDRLKGWKHQPKGKDHLGHKSVWVEQDFINMGFRVVSVGQRNVHPGHLLAWMIK